MTIITEERRFRVSIHHLVADLVRVGMELLDWINAAPPGERRIREIIVVVERPVAATPEEE